MERCVENLGKKITDPKVGYALTLKNQESAATDDRPGGHPSETPSVA